MHTPLSRLIKSSRHQYFPIYSHVIFTVADSIINGIDGRCESSIQDVPIVSADVLATWTQGSYIHKLIGGANEYGRTLEAKNRLWTSCSRLPVSLIT